jgi:hypothetical protein
VSMLPGPVGMLCANESCRPQHDTGQSGVSAHLPQHGRPCRCAGCRAVLGRGPDGMLSDGSDGKRLRTSVQFLAGHEGQYRLGSVAFRADGPDTDSNSGPMPENEHPPAEQPADTGTAPHVVLPAVLCLCNLHDLEKRGIPEDTDWAAYADVRLALDAVLASARGQSLLATEVCILCAGNMRDTASAGCKVPGVKHNMRYVRLRRAARQPEWIGTAQPKPMQPTPGV